MQVPGRGLAQVDLDKTDPCFDQSTGQKQRPAELVAAVAIQSFAIGMGDIKQGAPRSTAGQEREGVLLVAVVPPHLSRSFEDPALSVHHRQETRATLQASVGDVFGQQETGHLEERLAVWAVDPAILEA